MKNKKRLWMCLLTVMLCVGMFSTTAFAYVDESVTTEATTEVEATSDTESTEETNAESPGTREEEESPSEALTPEGNLTLVDDVGSSSDTEKQFVTLVTKSGNYFYLVIDRDDEGNNTVHFLNQVDEADLFSLMEEADAQKLQTELAEQEKLEQAEQEEVLQEEVKEPVQEQKSPNLIPTVIALIALIGGAVIFGFTKLKEKKREKEAVKPDPDEDYEDEMDYEFLDESEFTDREDNHVEEEEDFN